MEKPKETKEQKSGIKTQLKERWIDFLAIALAGVFTPIVLMWIGKQDSALTAIPVFILIMLLVAIIANVIKRNIEKKKK